MKFYIGVTDSQWFSYLSRLHSEKSTSGNPAGAKFFAIEPVFKLHNPQNFIVGGGFFVRHSFLPTTLAWDSFGEKNGTSNFPTGMSVQFDPESLSTFGELLSSFIRNM